MWLEKISFSLEFFFAVATKYDGKKWLNELRLKSFTFFCLSKNSSALLAARRLKSWKEIEKESRWLNLDLSQENTEKWLFFFQLQSWFIEVFFSVVFSS